MTGLSSGSTLLNLACTGDPLVGFLPGKYYHMVGDSDSGKTFLSMSCAGEACINPAFKKYRLIYDNIEDGMLMDLDALFSEEMADRVEPPEMGPNNVPVFSHTIESFYYHLDDAFKVGKPFIYILDSADALDSESADKKFQQLKKAFNRARDPDPDEKAEKVTGSYGDGKAKRNSEYLRKARVKLRDSGSILIIVSQTRDSMTGWKNYSGGRALQFYAITQVWSSVAEDIKKDVHGITRKIGVRVKLDVRKNHVTGKKRSVEIDIFPSYGIDDIGTCVDYLVEEGFWPKEKGKLIIDAKGLGVEGTRDKIIRAIEKRNLEGKLRELCGQCWAEVEEACDLQRKNRYASNDPTTH